MAAIISCTDLSFSARRSAFLGICRIVAQRIQTRAAYVAGARISGG
jgi:hypothetical protein